MQDSHCKIAEKLDAIVDLCSLATTSKGDKTLPSDVTEKCKQAEFLLKTMRHSCDISQLNVQLNFFEQACPNALSSGKLPEKVINNGPG